MCRCGRHFKVHIPFYLHLTYYHYFMLRLCCAFLIMLEIVEDLFRSGLLILLRVLLLTNSIISKLNMNLYILAHVCVLYGCMSIYSCSFCQLHKKLANELHVQLISWWNAGNVLRKRHFTLSILDGGVLFSLKKKEKSFQQTRKLSTELCELWVSACVCLFFLKNFAVKNFHTIHAALQKEKQNDDFPTFYYNDESLPWLHIMTWKWR